MRTFLITISYARADQDFYRNSQVYREKASAPAIAIKRAMQKYHYDFTKGKRNLQYKVYSQSLGAL